MEQSLDRETHKFQVNYNEIIEAFRLLHNCKNEHNFQVEKKEKF